MNILWLLVGVLAIAALWLAITYNSLIVRRNRTDESWSDIDVQLKRRYDLIPNLVETVKAYARHESQVFESVTEARSRAMGAKTPKEHAAAENALTETIKSLFAVAEAYPELKASQNFAMLQDELTDAEDKIQAARRFYNANVRDYNTSLQVFPTNLIAGAFGFAPREFFEITAANEREAVKVQF